jgi:hypothetical protein
MGRKRIWDGQVKIRKCLRCNSKFRSKSPLNRICMDCNLINTYFVYDDEDYQLRGITMNLWDGSLINESLVNKT